MGAGEYDIPYSPCKLYYKDGVAMCVQGMGKINAAPEYHGDSFRRTL